LRAQVSPALEHSVRHSCARRWHQLVLFSSGKASLEVFRSGLAGPLLAGARAMATRGRGRARPGGAAAAAGDPLIDAGVKLYTLVRLSHSTAAAAEMVVVKSRTARPVHDSGRSFPVSVLAVLANGEPRTLEIDVRLPVAFSKADALLRLHDGETQTAAWREGTAPLLKLKRGDTLCNILEAPSQHAAPVAQPEQPAAALPEPARGPPEDHFRRERSRSPVQRSVQRDGGEPTITQHQVSFASEKDLSLL